MWKHKEIIEWLRAEEYPSAKVFGFAKVVRGIVDDNKYLVKIVPDLYYYAEDQLFCIEVENSNPITENKMAQYAQLWFDLDFYDVQLYLLVYDKFKVEKSVPLGRLYFEILGREHAEC